jgi:hypothetical protein
LAYTKGRAPAAIGVAGGLLGAAISPRAPMSEEARATVVSETSSEGMPLVKESSGSTGVILQPAKS